jgi:L-serine dehydratase
MAASAACELLGATPEACINAAALALKSYVGLVCDPVAGLVESPCTKRNATGVCVALGCCEMSLAGVESVIPFDEVLSAIASVGRAIPVALKETSMGGLAQTDTAQRLTREIFE